MIENYNWDLKLIYVFHLLTILFNFKYMNSNYSEGSPAYSSWKSEISIKNNNKPSGGLSDKLSL